MLIESPVFLLLSKVGVRVLFPPSYMDQWFGAVMKQSATALSVTQRVVSTHSVCFYSVPTLFRQKICFWHSSVNCRTKTILFWETKPLKNVGFID